MRTMTRSTVAHEALSWLGLILALALVTSVAIFS